MLGMNRAENIKRQYADDTNLSVRTALHAKYSTNKQGFVPWLFENYRFFSNDSILELGCGNGAQWDGRIGQLPDGCMVTLSDLSCGMVEAAKGRLGKQDGKIAFRQIDIQEMPFCDESFDVVIANHMLYHVPDIDKALSEVLRVLKTGGRFYAATNGSGGMGLFIHNAIRKIDPETKAFSQREAFTLQNGGERLARYFPAVTRLDYHDSLAVTKTQDLMDWIGSTLSFSGYSQDYSDALYDYFETIRAKEGAINIPKEVGLFVCDK